LAVLPAVGAEGDSNGMPGEEFFVREREEWVGLFFFTADFQRVNYLAGVDHRAQLLEIYHLRDI
jgi:hypothetical protein